MFPSARDLATLVFQPKHPRLARCLEVVHETRSAAQAWRALGDAGLALEGERSFLDVTDSNARVSDNGGDLARLPFPPTPAACVAFASLDPSDVVQAEAAAHRSELFCDPWRSKMDTGPAAPSAAIVWDLLPLDGVIPGTPGFGSSRLFFAMQAARAALEAHDRNLLLRLQHAIQLEGEALRTSTRERLGRDIGGAVLGWKRWEHARALDLKVPSIVRRTDHGLGNASKALKGKPFNSFVDVLPPALEMVSLGFAFRGETLTLAAPRPPWRTLMAMSWMH